VVSLFLNATICAPFRARLDVNELLMDLKASFIDVNLVCAYMILGNQVQHEDIFADVHEFSCSDPFLGYCFWFLKKEVFVSAAEENLEHFARFELSATTQATSSNKEALIDRYENHLVAVSEESERRCKNFLQQNAVPPAKRDLFRYFFVSCTAQAPSPKTDAGSDAGFERVVHEA
jgi:hypothetical protein